MKNEINEIVTQKGLRKEKKKKRGRESNNQIYFICSGSEAPKGTK